MRSKLPHVYFNKQREEKIDQSAIQEHIYYFVHPGEIKIAMDYVKFEHFKGQIDKTVCTNILS